MAGSISKDLKYASCIRRFATSDVANPFTSPLRIGFEPDEFRVIGYYFMYDTATPAVSAYCKTLRCPELCPDEFLIFNNSSAYVANNSVGPWIPTTVSPNTTLNFVMLDADDGGISAFLTSTTVLAVMIEFRKALK